MTVTVIHFLCSSAEGGMNEGKLPTLCQGVVLITLIEQTWRCRNCHVDKRVITLLREVLYRYSGSSWLVISHMDVLHTQLYAIQQKLSFVATDPINWKLYVQTFSWVVTLFESYLMYVLSLYSRPADISCT